MPPEPGFLRDKLRKSQLAPLRLASWLRGPSRRAGARLARPGVSHATPAPCLPLGVGAPAAEWPRAGRGWGVSQRGTHPVPSSSRCLLAAGPQRGAMAVCPQPPGARPSPPSDRASATSHIEGSTSTRDLGGPWKGQGRGRGGAVDAQALPEQLGCRWPLGWGPRGASGTCTASRASALRGLGLVPLQAAPPPPRSVAPVHLFPWLGPPRATPPRAPPHTLLLFLPRVACQLSENPHARPPSP